MFFASPGRGQKVSCHDEIVETAEQKTRRQCGGRQRQPFVSVAGLVQVPQNLINGTEFKAIDVWIVYKFVLALAKAIN